ncbi:hypothetical protein [Demequina oxidasica]|uniref:hypothetical protein n=1 Tax=Demequina oxidasica TaxID=676199 RepID=UPI000B2CB415|nr:hypothetical protein [Demequina oxidasica]
MSEAPTSKWDGHLYMMLRGAIGGLVAGVIFGLFQMWFLADAGVPADTIIHMIATIVQPDEYFAAGTTSLAVGWAVHVGLSVTYGALLGLLAAEFKSNASRVALAGFYGLVIYMFNFLLLVPLFYPVFEIANQPFEAVVHVVYGFLLAPFLVKWRGFTKKSDELPAIVAKAAANADQPVPEYATYNPAQMR